MIFFWVAGCVLDEGAFEGECADGVDNDGSGAVDCEDPGCAETCAAGGCRVEREICVNEFMASNTSTIEDEYGETSDWIELHNPSEEGRSLDGYSITDDLEDPEKEQLAGLQIGPRGFLLLWASGDNTLGLNHLGFKLSSTEDTLGLYCPQGGAADELSWTQDQGDNLATGRIPDCAGEMQAGLSPTPGASNGE